MTWPAALIAGTITLSFAVSGWLAPRIWYPIRNAFADHVVRPVNDAVLRWCLQWHEPLDVSYDNDGTEAICPRCKTDWPCPEYQRLTRRRTEVETP